MGGDAGTRPQREEVLSQRTSQVKHKEELGGGKRRFSLSLTRSGVGARTG